MAYNLTLKRTSKEASGNKFLSPMLKNPQIATRKDLESHLVWTRHINMKFIVQTAISFTFVYQSSYWFYFIFLWTFGSNRKKKKKTHSNKKKLFEWSNKLNIQVDPQQIREHQITSLMFSNTDNRFLLCSDSVALHILTTLVVKTCVSLNIIS